MRVLGITLLIIIPAGVVSLLVVNKLGDATGTWSRMGPERAARAKRVLVVVLVLAAAVGVLVGMLLPVPARR